MHERQTEAGASGGARLLAPTEAFSGVRHLEGSGRQGRVGVSYPK